MLSTWYK